MFVQMEFGIISICASTRTSRVPTLILLFLLASLGAASQTLYASTSDGPAELPQVLIPTTMANTPAPGITITVNKGDNLQAALNNAQCGDTIHLQAGATFAGVFTFPNKNCDDHHWIVVRTSSDDSLLPPEGSRLTPCYAGVSSLPGRPAFNCSSTKNVLAKLVMNRGGSSGPVVFAPGASHYRLIGLEVTRVERIGVVYALASPSSKSVTSNIIYDRIWFHGTAHDETTRGIQLGGSSYVAVVDSFFTDFHCIYLTGSCTDSQAINGGINKHPMGPYKIVNNFLEASGENILFGGGAATYSPHDIEITHNYMFKPLTWMKGQPGYVGGANGNPFTVKNLFELKNAQRVLVDSNVMENTWGGFSQAGFAILLTAKGNTLRSPCPICQVTDVTIRNTYISHMGAGMQLSNGLSDDGAIPLDGGRYSIHDVIFDDMNGTKFHGSNVFAQVSTRPGAPALHDVTINHITAFPRATSLLIGDVLSVDPKMKNFVFTNSIINAGQYPVWSTGAGGSLNCAVHDSPLITFNACFTSYVFSHNALVASPASYPPSTWPASNFFPTSESAVEFVDYNGGSSGNYALQSTSRYKGAGTDGKDLGANVHGVNAAVAKVR
jgi:hypothetical protein